MRIRLPRPLVMAVAALVATGTAVLAGGGVANAADIGTLTVAPATGTDSSSMTVTTSAPCPAGATNLLVYVTGSGFPDGTSAPFQNVVGNTGIGTFSTDPTTGGIIVPLATTLQSVAASQVPPANLAGNTYRFHLVCRTALNPASLGDFVADIQFGQGTAGSIPYTVPTTKAASMTVPSGSPNPAQPGQQVTLSVTVSPTGGGTGTPTGTVQFMEGTTNIGGAVTLSGGTASTTTSFSTAGAHSISAVYSGDSAFNGSTGAFTETVSNLPATTTSLSANPAGPVDPGASVLLTSTVAPSSGTGTPTGTVQFKDGASNLGSPVTLTGGTAMLSINTAASPLGTGTHPLTAVYSGDGSFAGSSSPTVLLVINGPAGSSSASEKIDVTVPAGTLSITVADTSDVLLPDLQLNAAATLFSTSGPIHPATVTDTRAGDVGWSVSGQVTNFLRNGGTGAINGFNLGWTPSVVDHGAAQTVTAGAVVAPAPGIAPGATPSDPAQGLKTARNMATAPAGHGLGTAHLTANLALNAPTSTPAGTYSATLTLTAI